MRLQEDVLFSNGGSEALPEAQSPFLVPLIFSSFSISPSFVPAAAVSPPTAGPA